MDQIVVDVGDHPVRVGDEVVLLGTQGAAAVTAEEWAERLDTINYEIVCGFGGRLPRRHLTGGQ
jgi:alanine racemase